MDQSTLKTVISGSFRKHLLKIADLKQVLEELEVRVLSPEICHSKNPDDEFQVLDSDPVWNPELLQASVFEKIRESTFLVLANFERYIGHAAALEVGYSLAVGIKVYSIEEVTDPNISPFCTPISKVFPDLEKMLKKRGLN